MKERLRDLLSEVGDSFDYLRSDVHNLSCYLAKLDALIEGYRAFTMNAQFSHSGGPRYSPQTAQENIQSRRGTTRRASRRARPPSMIGRAAYARSIRAAGKTGIGGATWKEGRVGKSGQW